MNQVFTAANVDTALTLFAKGKPSNLTVAELSGREELPSHQVELSTIKPPSYIIQIGLLKTPQVRQLLEKVESRSRALSTFCTVSTGLKAYQIGKGKPAQTQEEKGGRVFHAASKLDDTYERYLEGADVRRYFLGWSGEYLSYGDWLAEPRKSVPFGGARLLVRQIPSKPPYLVNGVFTDQPFYNDINSMVIFSPVNDVSLKYLLGIINSRLISVWFSKTFDKLQRKIFPQFKVKELASFPIPPVDLSNSSHRDHHDRVVGMVERVLDLQKRRAAARNPMDRSVLERQIRATDRQLDRLVYDLYDLTDEEIEMVEEGSTAGS